MLGALAVAGLPAVTLPALRPAIASAAAITFLFTFTSFGVVRILGGPGRTTLEVEIYRQTADLLDLPVASVLALLQLTAVGAMLVVQDRLERRRAHRAVALRPAAAGTGPPAASSGRGSARNLAFLAVLARGSRSPRLVERSFRTGDGHGLAAWRALGGRPTAPALFVSPLEAIANSLRFAAGADRARRARSAGWPPAALARSRGHGAARSVDGVLLLPLGTSAVTVGFGFLIALDEPVDLRASPVARPVAQALVALPFVVRTMTPVLRSIDPRLHEAAAVLGASPRAGWRAIDLPLVRRAVLVAAGFAFAISLGEFGATTVIARADAPDRAGRHRPPARSARAPQRRPGLRAQHGAHGADRRRRARSSTAGDARGQRRGLGVTARLAVEAATVRFGATVGPRRRRPRGRAGGGRRGPRAERQRQVHAAAGRSPACSRWTAGTVLLDGVDLTPRAAPPPRRRPDVPGPRAVPAPRRRRQRRLRPAHAAG